MNVRPIQTLKEAVSDFRRLGCTSLPLSLDEITLLTNLAESKHVYKVLSDAESKAETHWHCNQTDESMNEYDKAAVAESDACLKEEQSYTEALVAGLFGDVQMDIIPNQKPYKLPEA